MKRLRGGHHLACPIFQARSGGLGGVPVSPVQAKGVIRAVLAGEVSGSGFAASVFDIWAMRDDGPPKMSSAKNDFASRNEVI